MTAPTRDMLLGMLALQDRMNRKIDADWLSRNHAWLRAVLVEATEALDHYGWKWWKKQSPDMVQLRIELIDIWHFILSEYIVRAGGDNGKAADAMLRDWSDTAACELDSQRYEVGALDMRQQLELLAGLSAVRRMHMPLLATLFAACELPAATLYRDYMSKNVLNHFRQDHGYKTGEYKKTWDGREDNVHMAELLEDMMPGGDLAEALYQGLKQRYDALGAAGRLTT
jgi:hypothetical protein